MSILNLEFSSGGGGRSPRNKRTVKVWVGIGLVATLMGVGTAFASTSINITPVGLGQGVTQVTACDNDVIVAPTAAGSGVGGDGRPTFHTVSVDIQNVSDNCNDSDFGIQFFSKYNTDPELYDDGYSLKVIPCENLGVTPSSTLACEGATKTVWKSVTGLSGGKNTVSITVDAPANYDYITLVSSAHSGTRF